MNPGIAEDAVACTLEEEASPYVKELKVILSDLVARRTAGHADYIGGSESTALYKDKELAVQLSFLDEGESFPEHYHPVEKEWLILVKGSATVWVDGEKRELRPRDTLILDPETNHRGIVNEASTFVCVAIPSDAGYPDVGY